MEIVSPWMEGMYHIYTISPSTECPKWYPLSKYLLLLVIQSYFKFVKAQTGVNEIKHILLLDSSQGSWVFLGNTLALR